MIVVVNIIMKSFLRLPLRLYAGYTRYTIHKTRAAAGFTLVELMVVVAISAILLAIAVPDFVRMTRSIQLQHQAKEMAGAIKLARAEALRRGQTVVMCRANAALTQCATGSPAWETGWIIFNDETPAGATQGNSLYDASSETLIAVKQPMGGNISAMADVSYKIIFNAAGETAGNLSNAMKITFQINFDTSTEQYLYMDRGGRVRFSSFADCQAGKPC